MSRHVVCHDYRGIPMFKYASHCRKRVANNYTQTMIDYSVENHYIHIRHMPIFQHANYTANRVSSVI